jgi:hypothetical protein
MKKAISNLLTIVSVLLLLWVAMSVFDVNIHNNPLSDNYQNFASWNIFELIF